MSVGVPVTKTFNKSKKYPYESNRFDRRETNEYFYLPVDCPRMKKCDDAFCPLAHTKLEKIFHPIVYKTQACQMAKDGTCDYFQKCAFYHDKKDKHDAYLKWKQWEKKWVNWRTNVDNILAEHNKNDKDVKKKVDNILKVRMPYSVFNSSNNSTNKINRSATVTVHNCTNNLSSNSSSMPFNKAVTFYSTCPSLSVSNSMHDMCTTNKSAIFSGILMNNNARNYSVEVNSCRPLNDSFTKSLSSSSLTNNNMVLNTNVNKMLQNEGNEMEREKDLLDTLSGKNMNVLSNDINELNTMYLEKATNLNTNINKPIYPVHVNNLLNRNNVLYDETLSCNSNTTDCGVHLDMLNNNAYKMVEFCFTDCENEITTNSNNIAREIKNEEDEHKEGKEEQDSKGGSERETSQNLKFHAKELYSTYNNSNDNDINNNNRDINELNRNELLLENKNRNFPILSDDKMDTCFDGMSYKKCEYFANVEGNFFDKRKRKAQAIPDNFPADFLLNVTNRDNVFEHETSDKNVLFNDTYNNSSLDEKINILPLNDFYNNNLNIDNASNISHYNGLNFFLSNGIHKSDGLGNEYEAKNEENSEKERNIMGIYTKDITSHEVLGITEYENELKYNNENMIPLISKEGTTSANTANITTAKSITNVTTVTDDVNEKKGKEMNRRVSEVEKKHIRKENKENDKEHINDKNENGQMNVKTINEGSNLTNNKNDNNCEVNTINDADNLLAVQSENVTQSINKKSKKQKNRKKYKNQVNKNNETSKGNNKKNECAEKNQKEKSVKTDLNVNNENENTEKEKNKKENKNEKHTDIAKSVIISNNNNIDTVDDIIRNAHDDNDNSKNQTGDTSEEKKKKNNITTLVKNENKNNQNKENNNENKKNKNKWKNNEGIKHILQMINDNNINEDNNLNGINNNSSNNNNDTNNNNNNNNTNKKSNKMNLSNKKNLHKNDCIHLNNICEKKEKYNENVEKQPAKYTNTDTLIYDTVNGEEKNSIHSFKNKNEQSKNKNRHESEANVEQDSYYSNQFENKEVNENNCEQKNKIISNTNEVLSEKEKKGTGNLLNRNALNANKKSYKDDMMEFNNLSENNNINRTHVIDKSKENEEQIDREKNPNLKREHEDEIAASSTGLNTKTVLINELYNSSTVPKNIKNNNNSFNKMILGFSRSVEHLGLEERNLLNNESDMEYNKATNNYFNNASLHMHSGYNDIYETFEKKPFKMGNSNMHLIGNNKNDNNYYYNINHNNSSNYTNNSDEIKEFNEKYNTCDFERSRKCVSEIFRNTSNNFNFFGDSKFYGQNCLQCKHYKGEIKNLMEQIKILRKELYNCKEIIKYGSNHL